MYVWRSVFVLLVLAANAKAKKFNLDDLTSEEIATLQAEMEQVYAKELAESNTTESVGENAGDGDEGSPEDGMEALNNMMADLLQKALASEAMKEILRKRIAEGTLDDLVSSDEEGQGEDAAAGGVSEDKDKEEGEEEAEGAGEKDYWEEKDEL